MEKGDDVLTIGLNRAIKLIAAERLKLGGDRRLGKSLGEHPDKGGAIAANDGHSAVRKQPALESSSNEENGSVSLYSEADESDEINQGDADAIDSLSRYPPIPNINEVLAMHLATHNNTRLCSICEQQWTSGKVLIDGSVFHEPCYVTLTNQSNNLSSQKEEILRELNKPTSLIQIITNWMGQQRETNHRNEMLKLQLNKLSSQIDTTTAKLGQLHDVWPSYPPDWAERRRLAMQRDGRKCTQCGRFKHLHLHHKRAIREGGTHTLTNLVLLCKHCHSEAHGGRKFHFRDLPGSGIEASAVEKRIRLINEAIASGRDVSFRYEKTDGTVTKRTVTPRELRKLSTSELHKLLGSDGTISREGRLCMFGRCHLRGADRVFAIDRIQNLHLQQPEVIGAAQN
jgi:hypothetical protein